MPRKYPPVWLCIGIALLSLCAGCDVPRRQKLVDCTTNHSDFPMRVEYSAPYYFVLGVPKSNGGQVNFRGELVLRRTNNVIARIPISSKDITPCNWLHSAPDLSGYVLGWQRTNSVPKLEDVLVRGETYDVQIAFDEQPPAGSSLWLSSVKR